MRIRKLREAAGLRAVDLADVPGLDPAGVSRLEGGQRSVKASELGTLAEFLGVSQLAILEPDSLLGRLSVAPRTDDGDTSSRDAVQQLTALAELHHNAAYEFAARRAALGPGRVVDTVQILRNAVAAGIITAAEAHALANEIESAGRSLRPEHRGQRNPGRFR